jgi:hypothetical protein
VTSTDQPALILTDDASDNTPVRVIVIARSAAYNGAYALPVSRPYCRLWAGVSGPGGCFVDEASQSFGEHFWLFDERVMAAFANDYEF